MARDQCIQVFERCSAHVYPQICGADIASDLDIGGDMVAFAMGLKIDSSYNRMYWWLYVKRPSCETLRSTEEDLCNGISATLSQISSVALVWRTRRLIPALT